MVKITSKTALEENSEDAAIGDAAIGDAAIGDAAIRKAGENFEEETAKVSKEDKMVVYDSTSDTPIAIHHKLREHMSDLEQIFFIHGERITSKLGSKVVDQNKLDKNQKKG